MCRWLTEAGNQSKKQDTLPQSVIHFRHQLFCNSKSVSEQMQDQGKLLKFTHKCRTSERT